MGRFIVLLAYRYVFHRVLGYKLKENRSEADLAEFK